MQKKFSLLAALLIPAAAVSLGAARGNPFQVRLSPDRKIVHALWRLTFGPRPGDVERVRSLGLEKWIDQQLHPERITENPLLAGKLAPLETTRQSATEMVRNYPPPQLLRAMAAGRIPYPSDPQKRQAFEQMAKRFRQAQGQGTPAEEPASEPGARAALGRLLTQHQIAVLRNGSPQEKQRLFGSFSAAQQEALLAAAPGPARRMMLAAAPTEVRRQALASMAPVQVVAQDLQEAKLYRAIYSNRQLEEVLTDFWFNHFNVYLDKGADRYLVTSYERDAIRPHVLGKFKDLLVATAEHPAMLFYLDNWQSVDPQAAEQIRQRRGSQGGRRRGLNENYARELLELHTLGVDGGYTQQDVIEVARCFTGWTIREPRRGGGFEFNERLHDQGEKAVLGVKIPAGGGMEDGLKVLDLLANHPSTARFVSTQLAQRFVADHPPPALIEKMAKTFRASGGDLREVLQTMLAAGEFWSEGAYQAKMKSPLEMVTSAVRALDADVTSALTLAFQVGQLGQPLYRKEEPTGYPNTGQDWVSSAALLGRMNFASALAANRVPGVHVDAARLATPESLPRTLLLANPSEQTRAAIAKALADNASGGDQPALIAGLTLGSPEFQRR
jgi:uncharacterized protein (DUF1800 family)